MPLQDIIANLFAPISIILMIIAVVIAAIPVMPGSLIPWLVALAAGIANGFQAITPAAMIVMTVIMIVSQLSDFWLPLLGVQGGGMSCLASIGAFAGGMAGTFLIPIPIVGTLIGTVAGALIADYVQRRRLESAVTAGKEAARLFVIGYVIRIGSSVLVAVVFFISLAANRF
jgi:hypothetical protein